MKQMVLMSVLLLIGTVGPIVFGPFSGLAMYYLFSVLRPQYMWEWALSGQINWSFYVGVATIVATFLYLPKNLRGRNFTVAHAAVLMFALWVTLSHIFALNAEVSSRWYWEYFKIFLMFFCGSVVIKEFTQIKILYLIAVFALGYIAYEFNFLYLFEHRLDVYHLGYGGLDNNGAGLMLAMGIPMAYFLWQGPRRWWRWVFLAMIPVMLHAVLMSYSRGAMVSLLLASPLLVLRSPYKKGVALFLAGLLFLLPILAGKEIRARFFSTEQYQQDNSAQSRFESWSAAWKIAQDYPVLGVGLRNADLLSYRYGADVRGRTIHSLYLQTAADSGFPAIVFYLLLLFATWRALRSVQKRCRTSTSEVDQLAYSLASGIEGAMAVFCIGALFLSVDVFELPYLLILLVLQLRSLLAQKEAAASPAHLAKVEEPATAYARA